MDLKRLTELDEENNEIKILVRQGEEHYDDGHTSQYIFSEKCPAKYQALVEKCYEIENHEEKMGADINTVLKALFDGFYFKPNEITGFIDVNRKKQRNVTDDYLCYSKDTVGLEKYGVFMSAGYDSKPLPLYKVSLSTDDLCLNVFVWTIHSGYTLYKQLSLQDYGITWALTEEELSKQ